MRLRRVEAVRYGDLAEAALGELGDTLTVVAGRNEAGKSTFTSLIRHVLYGFPRGRTSERLYLPPGGESRVGRLVFTEGGAEWVVERVEGPRGGESVVHGPDGEVPGATLLEPLTAGVGAGVFQTVFGFSLEELSDLDSLAGIQSRLYATTTGLEVNPHDVLEQLQADAEAVWAPRARTKLLHQLNARRRSLREERAGLEELAERFRDDRRERTVVASELDEVEAAFRDARHRHARLAALLDEARHRGERVAEDEEARDEQQRTVERLAREIAELEDVDALIGRAETIDRLGSRLELFRSEAERLERDRQRLQDLEEEIGLRLDELGRGRDLESLDRLELGVELESQLHDQEEMLRESRRRRDDSARRLVEACSERDVAVAAAEERSREAGLPADDSAVEAVGARLEAVDRLLILGRQAEARAPSVFPAVAASVVALCLALAGLALEEPQIVWAAAPPAALALGLFLWSWLRRRGPSEIESLVDLLDLESAPSAAELVEIKSRLEDVRRAWLAAEAAGQASDARDRAAEVAESACRSAEAKWIQWLEERGLATSTGQPAGAHGVLQILRDLKSLTGDRRSIESEIARRRQVCESFAAEAAAIDGDIVDGDGEYAGLAAEVEALLERLTAARSVDARRRDLSRQLALAEETRDAAASRAARGGERLREILAEAGLDEAQSVVDLEAVEAVARHELGELETRRKELLERRATLDGRLESGATESASSKLRLAEAGLAERIDEALERYAVRSMAVAILSEALQAFEAERQPAVIQRAQEIFSKLTGGRYQRIATPLGKFEPSVSGGEVVGRAPAKLSRSTAEQLFLALRLSYIENLAGAHDALPVLMDDILVNFDPGRRQAAAAVIADFASRRQVVFFTCHPQTVEAFESETPDCTVVDLDRDR